MPVSASEDTATSDREKAKAAQLARAKKYHIAVKDGGNITKPTEWKDVPDSAWGDPVNYRYPMPDKAHADNAAARWGDASNRSQYSSAEQKIIADRIRARQKHFGTDAVQRQDADEQNESLLSPPGESVSLLPGCSSSSSTAARPRARIATIQVCWIEDNARSLNGRIYPREAVDRLIASAIRKLADPSSLPMTCFLSHADADSDRTPALIGRVTRVWREGTRGMATIDLADTTAARDALALIAGGYLCTESLRAKGAELLTDTRYDVPVVGGDQLELEGIDLTNYPGLEQVARIQQIHLAEQSGAAEDLTDVFTLSPSAVHVAFKELGMPKKRLSPLTEAMLREEGILPRTSGDSPSMTDDNPSDSYQQKNYPVPDLVDPASLPTATSRQLVEAMKRTHDHLANVLDATLTPIHSKERLIPLAKPLSEAGRKLARKHATALMAAHDEAARSSGMGCAGGYHDALGMGQDGDDDSDESAVRSDGEQNPQMTPGFANQTAPGVAASGGKKGGGWQPSTGPDPLENDKKARKRALKEAVALLEQEGYDVKLERRKTETEQLQERLAALEAARAKEMAELKELLATTTQARAQSAPQRRSQVVGANIGAPLVGGQPMHGRHLEEQIKALNWSALTDRTAPLPEDIPLELLIKHFEQYYAVLYDNRYGILTAAGR
jgi:hypothetical protein